MHDEGSAGGVWTLNSDIGIGCGIQDNCDYATPSLTHTCNIQEMSNTQTDILVVSVPDSSLRDSCHHMSYRINVGYREYHAPSRV